MNGEQFLNWCMTHYGEVITLVILIVVGIGYLVYKLATKPTHEQNTNFTNKGSQSAPIVQGNHAGGNIILEDNSTHYHVAQQLPEGDESTKRKAKLEEQGRLPLEDRTWRKLTEAHKAEMDYLYNAMKCRIRCAYVSSPFWSSEYDTECKAYVIRTFEGGYIQQTIGHHKLDPAYTDNIWPYYFLIVSNRDKTLLEMHPHEVMCFRKGFYRDGMTMAEQLYNDIDSKFT